jgi:pre-mRNA-splicing factor SYF1
MQLWHSYLSERTRALRHLPLSHSSYEALNNTFERALVTMHKMPRIWLEHIASLKTQVQPLTNGHLLQV